MALDGYVYLECRHYINYLALVAFSDGAKKTGDKVDRYFFTTPEIQVADIYSSLAN